MNLSVAIQPAAAPIALDEAKRHLSIDEDQFDLLVPGWIAAATRMAETETQGGWQRQTPLVVRTFELKLDAFPCGSIWLPCEPILSVESISYTDQNGDAQTADDDTYTLDPAGSIHLAYNEAWPCTQPIPNAVTVRFVAGLVAPFTVAADTNIVTLRGRTPVDGEIFRVMNSGGTLPGGLLRETDYYAIDVSGNTCKLSESEGGSAVDITSRGSGTHFAGADIYRFEVLRSAMKLLLGHWEQNREAVNVGNIVTPLPMGVAALINASRP